MVDAERVRRAQEEISIAEARLICARSELEEALKQRNFYETNEPRAERTIVRFSLRYSSGAVYHYAAIKADGYWYVAGNASNRRLTWAGVWKLINSAELIDGEEGFVVFPAASRGERNG